MKILRKNSATTATEAKNRYICLFPLHFNPFSLHFATCFSTATPLLTVVGQFPTATSLHLPRVYIGETSGGRG